MTVNEDVRDKIIRHNIWLYRYETGQIKDILKSLEELDKKLTLKFKKYDTSKLSKSKLKKLKKDIKDYIREGKEILQTKIENSASEMVEEETQWVEKVFETSIPKEIPLVVRVPDVGKLETLVMDVPFEDTVFRDVASTWSASKEKTFINALKYGFYYGQTVDQVYNSLFGTKEFGMRDGINKKFTNRLKTNIRTGLQNVANLTRQEMYKSNNDLVKGEEWVSTLDTRTTPLCMSMDGKVKMYDGSKDEFRGLEPPAHYGCRSCTVPILKSWRELGIDADEVGKGTRASMNGQVPVSLKYPEWFKTQSAKVQEQILGKTKYQWMKEGKFDFKDFIDEGKYLTIKQLKERM